MRIQGIRFMAQQTAHSQTSRLRGFHGRSMSEHREIFHTKLIAIPMREF